MSCLKYYTTGSLVKVITMMNESIESTESWVSLICMFLILFNKKDKIYNKSIN